MEITLKNIIQHIPSAEIFDDKENIIIVIKKDEYNKIENELNKMLKNPMINALIKNKIK